jgi:hypothetical protein
MNLYVAKLYVKKIRRSLRPFVCCIGAATAATLPVNPALAQWGDKVANCRVQIVSAAHTDFCLSYESTADGSIALLRRCSTSLSYSWNIRLADDGGIFLESSQAPQRVLEVSGGSMDWGGRVQFWGLNIPAWRRHQQWNIVPAMRRPLSYSDFAVNILSENSRLCLDVRGWWMAERTQVWQWPCHGGTNQEWRIVGSSDPWCTGMNRDLLLPAQ